MINVFPRIAVLTFLATVVLTAAFSISPAIAIAAPSPTPNGFTGAANMLSAWPGVGPGVPVGGGMENAMNVDNPNGNTGMFTAVGVSGGN